MRCVKRVGVSSRRTRRRRGPDLVRRRRRARRTAQRWFPVPLLVGVSVGGSRFRQATSRPRLAGTELMNICWRSTITWTRRGSAPSIMRTGWSGSRASATRPPGSAPTAGYRGGPRPGPAVGEPGCPRRGCGPAENRPTRRGRRRGCWPRRGCCLVPCLMEAIKPPGARERWQQHGSTPTNCGSARSGWCAMRAARPA